MNEIDQKTLRKSPIMPWIIVGLGALYYCYEYLLRISPSVMAPDLMRYYNLSGLEFGSFSAYYYHAYTPMQILVGLLMDRYGPRRLLTFACVLCALGSFMFASGVNLVVADVGRFLVGLGSAFAFVGALKLATIWLPPNRFALVSGVITCLGMVGAMTGDILLRYAVVVMGWKSAVYISAMVGVVLSVILWGIIRDHNPYHEEFHAHTSDFRTLFTGLWTTLKSPQIWLNGLIGLLLYLSLSAFGEIWGIPFLEQAHLLSPVDAASVNSMVFLGWAVGGPFWGWFSDHIESRLMPLRFCTLSALIVICVLIYVPGMPVIGLYALMFIFGFFCSVQILVFAICRESSPLRVAATAIALTNMIVMFGGNVFQPVIGKLLDLRWTGAMAEGARLYSNSAYELALTIIPVSFVIALLVLFLIQETHGQLLVDQR
jgi:sugar phosphate permease